MQDTIEAFNPFGRRLRKPGPLKSFLHQMPKLIPIRFFKICKTSLEAILRRVKVPVNEGDDDREMVGVKFSWGIPGYGSEEMGGAKGDIG